MADSFTTQSRSVSFKPLLVLLLFWGRLHRYQCLLGNSLALEESLFDGFPTVNFVVDMAECRGVYFFLFSCLFGAYSCTKLQLVVFGL